LELQEVWQNAENDKWNTGLVQSVFILLSKEMCVYHL